MISATPATSQATGERLRTEPGVLVTPTWGELERRGRVLRDVLDLAQSLPFRRDEELRFPHLQR